MIHPGLAAKTKGETEGAAKGVPEPCKASQPGFSRILRENRNLRRRRQCSR